LSQQSHHHSRLCVTSSINLQSNVQQHPTPDTSITSSISHGTLISHQVMCCPSHPADPATQQLLTRCCCPPPGTLLVYCQCSPPSALPAANSAAPPSPPASSSSSCPPGLSPGPASPGPSPPGHQQTDHSTAVCRGAVHVLPSPL
jgi:hypothetical protein